MRNLVAAKIGADHQDEVLAAARFIALRIKEWRDPVAHQAMVIYRQLARGVEPCP